MGGEVGGGWEREMMMMTTSVLERQRDVIIKREQLEQQQQCLLMQLPPQHIPRSKQGGGGGGFVVHNGNDDLELNSILARLVKVEHESGLPKLVAGGGTEASASGSCGISRTVSCPPRAGANSNPAFHLTAENVALGRENLKKRKASAGEKAFIPPPPMKPEDEKESEQTKERTIEEEEERQPKVKKNGDQQLCCDNNNNNNNGHNNCSSQSNENKSNGEVVSACSSKGNKNSNSREAQNQKPDYIHVRARRGQATDSHSLAERVRREKISERMKYLQDLVPGCSKITGKAGMLDEIINYVQSLQRQVEFLSMKLAAVNPRLDFNMDHFFAKEALASCSSYYQPPAMPIITSKMDNDPGLHILYNPTQQHQTGLVSEFEMVMNQATSDHMSLRQTMMSAPISDFHLVSAAAAATTPHHSHLSYLTQEVLYSRPPSWNNGVDVEGIFTMEFQQPFSGSCFNT